MVGVLALALALKGTEEGIRIKSAMLRRLHRLVYADWKPRVNRLYVRERFCVHLDNRTLYIVLCMIKLETPRSI